jgi:hypothetical protein
MKKYLLIFCSLLLIKKSYAQNWVLKENILKFPNNFESWLMKHNGGVPIKENRLGSNQGVEMYDFNRDGKKDLLMQIFPSNDITREYLRGIFIQDSNGNFNLDTNYVIKGKGDMWYGACGDFNGDGLTDYHYITQNFHGQDSTRKYSPEMIYDNWPERAFINNGKSFDTVTIDRNNIKMMSSYVADINKDGRDEIITTSRDTKTAVVIYSYNNITKKFDRVMPDVTRLWEERFSKNGDLYAMLNYGNFNSETEFATVYRDKAIPGLSTPFSFSIHNFTIFNYNTLSFKQIEWERKERMISKIISRSDQDDIFKFNFYENRCIYQIDIDKDGKNEFVAGGFYMNNYALNPNRYAYGLQIFNESGKEVTDNYLADGGYDNNVDLGLFSADIDRNIPGNEIIPSAWGVGGGDISYVYAIKENKLKKHPIKIVIANGDVAPANSLNAKQLSIFQDNNKPAVIFLYDFNNLRATTLISQVDCTGTTSTITAEGPTTISQIGNVILSANTGVNYVYQWYKDKVAIANAKTSTYKATSEGSYTVNVTTTLGCDALSSAILVKTVFILPSNNFQINVQSESCRTSDNGKISIKALQNLNYTSTLTKSGGGIETSNFTSSVEFGGLTAGNYTLCITVAGQPDYKQCFEIVISEPKDLSVYSQLNPTNNILKLALSGGSTYRISLNGKTFSTSSNTYNLGLKNGLNKVIVMTDKECQGVYQEELYVNEKDLVYPNPFTDILNIKIKQEDALIVQVNIYDSFGLKVYKTIHAIQNGTIQLDLSKLYNGYYSIVVGKDVYKVLKK